MSSNQVDLSSYEGYRTLPPEENVHISMVQRQEAAQGGDWFVPNPNSDNRCVTNGAYLLACNDDLTSMTETYGLEKQILSLIKLDLSIQIS